jgi:hypothetical protein
MKIDFNSTQQKNFMEEALGLPSYPLDSAVTWIQDNLEPEEVFTQKQLEDWAYDAGFKRFE